jgi:predicted AAA+ superfamily ATPase
MYQIERTAYLNTLHKYLEAPATTVVTGLRRVGKSVLLRQLSEQLKEKGFQVVYIDNRNSNFGSLLASKIRITSNPLS